jgi:hypothetical protein
MSHRPEEALEDRYWVLGVGGFEVSTTLVR